MSLDANTLQSWSRSQCWSQIPITWVEAAWRERGGGESTHAGPITDCRCIRFLSKIWIKWDGFLGGSARSSLKYIPSASQIIAVRGDVQIMTTLQNKSNVLAYRKMYNNMYFLFLSLWSWNDIGIKSSVCLSNHFVHVSQTIHSASMWHTFVTIYVGIFHHTSLCSFQINTFRRSHSQSFLQHIFQGNCAFLLYQHTSMYMP